MVQTMVTARYIMKRKSCVAKSNLTYRNFITFLLFLCITSHAQTIETTPNVISIKQLQEAPPEVQKRKAFQREKWFYEQRAYPHEIIPADGRAKALMQKLVVNHSIKKGSYQSNLFSYTPWDLVGPAPGQYSNWGFVSGRITAIALDPKNSSRIFLGSATGGIWRSRTKGNTFAPISDHESSLATGSIAIDPNNTDIVYVGTGEATYSGSSYGGAGFMKSTDGGNSWYNISTGIPPGSVTSRILVSSQYSSLVIASLGPRGIYRSTDAGNTWYCVFTTHVDDIIFYPPDNNIVFGIGGGGTGLIKSTDAGKTWFSYGNGLPREAGRMHIDICRDVPNVLYATTYNEAVTNKGKVNVYISSNTGESWTQVGKTVDFNGTQAWYDFYIRTSPTDPKVCFVGTIEIFRTTDGGASWTDVSRGYSGGAVHVDQHDLRFDFTDPKLIYVACDGGLYKSANLGDTWQGLNDNLILTQFYRIASDPSDEKHIIGGTQDNGTQQTFGQLMWTLALDGDGGEACFSPANPLMMMCEWQYGGLFRSSNGGSNWENAMDGIIQKDQAAWIAPIVAHQNNANTFYHGRINFYKTTNGGKNWINQSDSLFGNSVIEQLAISNHPTAPVIYASRRSNIKRSTDDGKTFTPMQTGLPDRVITSIATHPDPDSSIVVFVTCSGHSTDHVYRSSYDGNGWISISGNLPDVPVNDIFVHPDFPDSWFAVATDVGVFFTEDGGVIWNELSTYLPNTVAMHLDYNVKGKKLRVATHGRSVWEITLTSLPVEPPKNLIAIADYRKVQLTWDQSSTPNVDHYSIYRGTKTGLGNYIANADLSLNYSDFVLENNTTYYYRIRAVTPNDSSLLSGEVSATPKVWQGCSEKVLSLNANGTGDYLTLPPTLNTFDEMTIEGWVWWKDFNNWSHLIDLGESTKSLFIANEASTNNLVFQINDTSDVHTINVPRILTKDRPIHIAAVSGQSGMKLYVDGQLAGSNPFQGSVRQTGSALKNNFIGHSNRSTDSDFYGKIDEIRIWKTERRAEQIRNDFNRKLLPSEIADTNLVMYLDFENASDSLVYDASLQKNNARLIHNAAVIDCTTPVSVEKETVLPAGFELRQNHPNPFGTAGGALNNRTAISFTLHSENSVSLDVYNTLGIQIAKMLNNESLMAGEYTEYFDGSSLPSGMYLYVLRAGNQIATKKMMLVR